MTRLNKKLCAYVLVLVSMLLSSTAIVIYGQISSPEIQAVKDKLVTLRNKYAESIEDLDAIIAELDTLSNDTTPKSYVLLKANFHTHTNYSDGSYTPTEVVELYYSYGYHVLAITDHTGANMSGCQEARDVGEALNMTVLYGEEISCRWSDGTHKHIVALFINETIPLTFNGTDIVQPYFDEVERQGGLSYVAHPWRTWDNWMIADGEGITPTGWEVTSWRVEERNWVFDNGYNYLCNNDFHRNIDALTRRWSIVISTGTSETEVKEALVEGRVVLWFLGRIYGSNETLALYYSVLAQNELEKSAENLDEY